MDHLGHDQQSVHAAQNAGWLIVLALALPLAAYLGAVARQSRRKSGWNHLRTLAFVAGIALLAIALSPPLSAFAHDDPRGHMVQHLLVGMFAPLGLVLSAPVTVLLRTVPVQWGRRVASVLRSWVLHVLTHPAIALALNIGGIYLLYGTSLYAATLTNPLLHAFVLVHFFVAGYLFTWVIAGPDPAPGRPGIGVRVVVLIGAIAMHATLAKLMYAHLWPRGTRYEEHRIQEAAMLMYYGGDLAELLLAVALFATWYRHRQRRAMRVPALNTVKSASPLFDGAK